MRRFLIPLVGIAAAAALHACHSGTGELDCLDAGASAYDTRLPGDTSVSFAWPGGFQPVRVYAEPVGSLQANTAASMQLWLGAFRCGELSLQSWPDSTTADIVVRNPASLPGPPTTAPVAASTGDSLHACFGRSDIQVDTVNNVLVRPIRSYVAPSPGTIDTASIESCYHFVTAHEIGHALGLLTESPDTNDIMNAVPRRAVLSADDRFTIQLLYHTVVSVRPSSR